jgi:hypothetical protein
MVRAKELSLINQGKQELRNALLVKEKDKYRLKKK